MLILYLCRMELMYRFGSENVNVHGAVIVLLADTLAAHDLGGFKVGVGFALRKGRVCLVRILIFNPR